MKKFAIVIFPFLVSCGFIKDEMPKSDRSEKANADTCCTNEIKPNDESASGDLEANSDDQNSSTSIGAANCDEPCGDPQPSSSYDCQGTDKDLPPCKNIGNGAPPFVADCVIIGERPNKCVKTVKNDYESRDPNYNNRSCWLQDGEIIVDDQLCARANDSESLKLYGPCGEGVSTFVTDLDPALDGKECFESVPDVTTLSKWTNPEDVKPCSEYGLDVKNSAICTQKGLKCYSDDTEPTTCSAEQTFNQKVTFRRTYSCDYYSEDALCPVSRRKAKEKIHYLSDQDREILAGEILNVRPTTYSYKDGLGFTPGPRLGFIIDDQQLNSALISRSLQSVDLYKYLTALVVTVQEQQRQIDDLKKILGIQAANTAQSGTTDSKEHKINGK